jgi:hypothetical protein
MPWRAAARASADSTRLAWLRQQRAAFCGRIRKPIRQDTADCYSPLFERYLWQPIHWGPHVLCVQKRIEEFKCGLHPNSETTAYVFDAASGTRLYLTDFIRPARQEAFLKLAQQHFERAQGLDQKAGRSRGSFTFDYGQFYLPDQEGQPLDSASFRVTPRHLSFSYDPYAIASYGFGYIQFRIPWQAIPLSMRRRGRWQRMLKAPARPND